MYIIWTFPPSLESKRKRSRCMLCNHSIGLISLNGCEHVHFVAACPLNVSSILMFQIVMIR